MNSKQDLSSLFYILFSIVVIGFGSYQYYGLYSRHTELNRQFVSLTERVNLLQADLNRTLAEKADLTNSLTGEKQRNDDLAGRVAGITDTVGTLQKLSNTDKELLQKYSKVYFLSDNYVPSSLATITPVYLLNEKIPEQIHSGVLPRLEAMIKSAEASGVDLKISSAYRSFDTQAAVKSRHLVVYGSGANKFSADQGYSEHQLGTTIDVTDKTGNITTTFEKTKAYEWLLANAYKYGFIISYPKQNTYYQFEPWHWRFVGVSLATKIHDSGKYFYNFSQREISTYLVNIFD